MEAKQDTEYEGITTVRGSINESDTDKKESFIGSVKSLWFFIGSKNSIEFLLDLRNQRSFTG